MSPRQAKPKAVKCAYPGCKQEAATVYSSYDGDKVKESGLCAKHLETFRKNPGPEHDALVRKEEEKKATSNSHKEG